jgi:hypothetical protein
MVEEKPSTDIVVHGTPISSAMDLPWPGEYPSPDDLLRFLVENDIGAVYKDKLMRAAYILWRCKMDRVDPTTKTWIFIKTKDEEGGVKYVPYPTKSWAAQKRKNEKVSIELVKQEITPNGIFMVLVKATTPDGRQDVDLGCASFKDRKGIEADPADQAIMFRKAWTQAKRRVTLSLLGEGTDEARGGGADEFEVPMDAPLEVVPAPRKGKKAKEALPEPQDDVTDAVLVDASPKAAEEPREAAKGLPATPTPPTPAPVRVTATGRKVFDPRKDK